VTRFHINAGAASGGLTVRIADGDAQLVGIRFFDEGGADLSEDAQRKIERYFNREDFRRVLPAEIGDINFAPRALESYAASLEETVDIGAIKAARFKVVIDYAFGSTAFSMPNVLSKLGADVLAVNPYASTAGLIGFDAVQHAHAVANLVQSSGAQVGAVIDPDGERLTLVDDEGRVLTPTQAMLAFVWLVSDRLLGDRIALPVGATAIAAELAQQRGVAVEYTKMSEAALAAAAQVPGVGFVASHDGGVILPGFLPAFDGAAALVKLLDLLAHHGVRLSDVVDQLPRVHLAHETVVTPWDQKGAVMRSLVEHVQRETVLVDGVKVLHDGGWALALPDPEEAVTHVYAEGATDAEARRLAREYVLRIRQLVR
jgi:mannose-1-phosphate guanylyltransferase/phosphomannomutase